MRQITLNGKTVDLTLRQMTMRETEIFLSIMTAPGLAINAPYKDEPDDPPLPQMSRIIHHRLTWCEKTTTPAVLIWLGLTCNGNPGTAVLMAYIIHKLARTSKQKVISITDLSEGIFAMGVPDEKCLSALWDAQKDGKAPRQNLLDNPEFFKL